MKIVDVFHGKTGGGYLTQVLSASRRCYISWKLRRIKTVIFKFVAAEGVNEDGPIFTFGDTNMRTRFSIWGKRVLQQME